VEAALVIGGVAHRERGVGCVQRTELGGGALRSASTIRSCRSSRSIAPNTRSSGSGVPLIDARIASGTLRRPQTNSPMICRLP